MLEETEVLGEEGAVAGAGVEVIEGSIEKEGEFELGTRCGGGRGVFGWVGCGVGWEEGDVERVILISGSTTRVLLG